MVEDGPSHRTESAVRLEAYRVGAQRADLGDSPGGPRREPRGPVTTELHGDKLWSGAVGPLPECLLQLDKPDTSSLPVLPNRHVCQCPVRDAVYGRNPRPLLRLLGLYCSDDSSVVRREHNRDSPGSRVELGLALSRPADRMEGGKVGTTDYGRLFTTP